jgi:uncharacterized protein involved in exopolysaccharide biosynthesis
LGRTIRENREQSASVEEPEFDLREVVHVLHEYKWLIVGITAVVVVAGIFWTARTPKIFEATSTVEYDPNPSKPLGGQVDDVADPIGNYWATREFFGTQNLVIASRDVAGRVTHRLGLHEDPTYLSQDDDALGPTGDVEATTLALQSRLTVEPVPETRLVRIHARDVKPERARLIADAVAEAYVQKTIEDRLESTDRANFVKSSRRPSSRCTTSRRGTTSCRYRWRIGRTSSPATFNRHTTSSRKPAIGASSLTPVSSASRRRSAEGLTRSTRRSWPSMKR